MRLEDAAFGDDGGGRGGLSSAARDLSRPKPRSGKGKGIRAPSPARSNSIERLARFVGYHCWNSKLNMAKR